MGRRDRVRNVRIREMCGWKRGLAERAEEGTFRRFGHVCRTKEMTIAWRVFVSEMRGLR